MTYSQKSKENCLVIDLRDLGIDESAQYIDSKDIRDLTLFKDIVLLTPTNQSHLGKKFKDYKKLTNNKNDEFLDKLFNGLGVHNIYLFTSYIEGAKKKNNLYQDIKNDENLFLLLRCDNGVKNSLFMAIRNAIAHGNIVKQNGRFVFYSVSDDKKEYDSNVTFFLKIKKVNNLKSFIKTLEQYN